VKTSLDCTNLEINWHLDPLWFNYHDGMYVFFFC
jgi:hypothetical protein